jgi:hypothetical protein
LWRTGMLLSPLGYAIIGRKSLLRQFLGLQYSKVTILDIKSSCARGCMIHLQKRSPELPSW